MKKHKLYAEINYDFGLIGISSHEKPYKLAWALNQKMGLNLTMTDDLAIKVKAREEPLLFTRFKYIDDHEIEYNLLSNKSEDGFLIPDMNNFDYFLQLTGNDTSEKRDELIKDFRKIDIVIAALKLDPNCLRKKDRFIY